MQRIGYGLLIALLLAAALSTGRKTAVILPVVAAGTLLIARPRLLLTQWPLILTLLVVIKIAAPDAISGIRYQFSTASSQGTTLDRTSDYSAVWPDIKSHLAFGRGFGSYDPGGHRVLDNQMLLMTVEVGVLGVLAYMALIICAGLGVRRALRGRDPPVADIARSLIAAAALFFVSNFLYDAFTFRQAPYAFLLVAALGVALMRGLPEVPSRSARVARSRPYVDTAEAL